MVVLSIGVQIMKTLFCIVIPLCFASLRLSAQVQVYYFISPTCPICTFYTLEMRDCAADYAAHKVECTAFAVGPLLTDSMVAYFRKEYKIPFEVIRDDSVHRRLNATVTPEVFVMDHDTVVYHGRIDDSFVRVGKRRAHVKNRELRNALDHLLANGAPITANHVPAIGCIIEK